MNKSWSVKNQCQYLGHLANWADLPYATYLQLISADFLLTLMHFSLWLQISKWGFSWWLDNTHYITLREALYIFLGKGQVSRKCRRAWRDEREDVGKAGKGTRTTGLRHNAKAIFGCSDLQSHQFVPLRLPQPCQSVKHVLHSSQKEGRRPCKSDCISQPLYKLNCLIGG